MGRIHVEILLKERLEPRWEEWFYGLALSPAGPDHTLLCGALTDRPAMHGVLERIRDLNLKIVSVVVRDEE